MPQLFGTLPNQVPLNQYLGKLAYQDGDSLNIPGDLKVDGALTVGTTTSTAPITIGQSTAAQTLNLGTGLTANATTKTIKLGTGGQTGSTTNITIGSEVSGVASNISAYGTWTYSGVTNFTAGGNQLLLKNSVNNDSTVIHRKDGTDYYILFSAAGTSPSGTWNTLRPFVINQTTGLLSSQNGQSFSGGLTTSSQITSTVVTNTAPFVVASTTRVANLNVATAGNADTVTNGVYTTGAQIIAGSKTFTDTLITNVGGAVASTTASAVFANGNYALRVYPRLGAGSYNSIVQTDDTGLIFSTGTQNAGALVIAPWSSVAGGVGLRMTSDGNTTISGNLTSTGILKASQILQGTNVYVRDYASGFSTTVVGSTLYELGRLTFTGVSQNVAIVGEIRGGSGASVGVNRFILNIRTDTPVSSKSFTFFEEEITNLGRVINVRVYHDTASGLVVIGYTTNASLQNIGWSLRVQERGDYNYLQQTVALTALNTAGLTEVTTTSTVRTISSTLEVPNGITADLTGNATNVTGVVALANGGSGAATAQLGMNAFAGAVTSGSYLRGNGTNVVMSAIQAADIPSLDANKITSGTIDAARLPSYVDDVLEYANLAAFPATGETGKIYIDLDTNKTYRWGGTVYVSFNSGAVDSVAGKTGIVTLTSSDVGLGSVENKSSATIRGEITSANVTTALGFTPLSNATSYLPIAGGTLTGNLTVPTLYSSGTTYYLAAASALTAQSTTAGSRINDLRFATLWKDMPANSGPILTYTLTSGGTDYVDGSYPNIVLSGGQGVYATFDFTVVGGIVTVATITERGSGFQVGNTLTITALGGTGSGGLITVDTVRTVDISLYGASSRIRLGSNDTSLAAGQELGGIYFNARDAAAGGAGDTTYILGVAVGTTGGGELQFWTAPNAGAPKLAAVIGGTSDFRIYNSAGTFYNSLVSAATANRIITMPDAAGTMAVIGTTDVAGFFNTSATTPTGTTRLNYSGNFYVTNLNTLGTGDTATAATHYFVETASDGFVRPKTLANVKTELVTAAAVATAVTSADIRVDSFGVGTAASGTTGEIRATSNITGYYTSDRSLKENIRNITGALDKVLVLNGVMFDWKQSYIEERGGEDGYFVRKADTGVIAQEVELVLPEIVGTRGSGIKAVAYEKLVPLLIEAIKELKAEVDALRLQVK
jgi:hypothetical protein